MKQKVSSLVIKIEEFINNRYYPVQSQDIFIEKNKKSDARVSKNVSVSKHFKSIYTRTKDT